MSKLNSQTMLMLYGPATMILGAVSLAALHLDLPVSMLTCDLAGMTNLNPLCGLLSSLGILLWCVMVSVSLFAASVMVSRRDRRQTAFLTGFAVLSLILMLDDLFMFHEQLAEEYLGLRQRHVIITYMALACGLLVLFRKVILADNYSLLISAIAFFSFSIGIEKALSYNRESWFYLAEDGAKFLGLISWAGYFIRHSWIQINRPETVYGDKQQLKIQLIPKRNKQCLT